MVLRSLVSARHRATLARLALVVAVVLGMVGIPGRAGMQVAAGQAAGQAAKQAGRQGQRESLRLVVVRSHELLGSEARALASLRRGLERRGFAVRDEEASADERRIAEGCFGGAAQEGALPAAWREVGAVVAIRIATPSGRTARGVDGICVWRPPVGVPRFQAVIGAAWPFRADSRFEAFLVPLLGERGEGAR